MRWFKHLSRAYNEEGKSELLYNFGPLGYGVLWLILEKIADQMDKSDRCFVRYSFKKWANSCGVSVKKFQKIVKFLAEIGEVSTEICQKNSDFLIIECLNLLKLRDEYSKKSGHTPDTHRIKSVATPEQETETETETEINNRRVERQKNKKPQIQNPYERPPSPNQESQEDKQKREKLIKRMHDFPYPNACIGDLGMNTPSMILEYGLDQTERKQTEIYQETGILDNFRADSYLRKVIENISKEGFISKDERIEKQEQRLKDTESAKKLDKKMKELRNINYYYSGLGQTEPHRQKQFNSFSTDIRYDILTQDSDLYLNLNYKASQTIKEKFKTEVILKMMSEKNIRVDQLLKWSISLLSELMKSEKE